MAADMSMVIIVPICVGATAKMGVEVAKELKTDVPGPVTGMKLAIVISVTGCTNTMIHGFDTLINKERCYYVEYKELSLQ